MILDDRFARYDEAVERHMARWTDELVEFCRIPSETGHVEALRDAAAWTSAKMRALGADVEKLALDGVPPLVVGEIGEGPVTVVCLQHYDVQPADPVDLWTSDPFEPVQRDGRVFARGAFDNKGQLLLRLNAVEAYLEQVGELPCRIRFLVEGEEESGSRHLAELLDRDRRLVTADALLNEAGYLDPSGRPMLTCGIRGLLYLELSVRTLARDAHSGAATLLPNAASRLANAVATMVGPDGTVLVEGFDRTVLPPTAAQLDHLRRTPFDEEGWRSGYGAKGLVAGRSGFEAHVASVFAPTLNVAGFSGGWRGPGMKTVIPAEAVAKIDMRLVPAQDPVEVASTIRTHLDERGYLDVEIEALAAERPWWTPVDHAVVEAAASATRAIYECEPLRVISAMGSAPLYQVCAPNRLPAVGFGCGHHDHRAHAPDENIRLDAMRAATRVFGRFLPSFAQRAATGLPG